MANIALNEDAELNLQMEAMTEDTEGHCDVWNVRHKQLLENDKYFEKKRKETNQGIENIKKDLNGLSFGISDDGCLAVTYDDGTEEV